MCHAKDNNGNIHWLRQAWWNIELELERLNFEVQLVWLDRARVQVQHSAFNVSTRTRAHRTWVSYTCSVTQQASSGPQPSCACQHQLVPPASRLPWAFSTNIIIGYLPIPPPSHIKVLFMRWEKSAEHPLHTLTLVIPERKVVLESMVRRIHIFVTVTRTTEVLKPAHRIVECSDPC